MSVQWRDNRDCLELIEGRPLASPAMGGAASSRVRLPGILVGLADAWRLREAEADGRFVSELHRCLTYP